MKDCGNYPPIPPGIDIHVHDREPSPINSGENYYSGSLAGLIGGWGARADMPNTQGHETWTFERGLEKHRLIGARALVYMGIYAGSQENSDNHNQLGPLSRISLGVKGYLGPTTGTEGQTYFKLDYYWDTYALWHNLTAKPILIHRGEVPVEEVIDNIARRLKHKLHICHEHDPDAVEVIAKAKKEGLPVSVGVTPHALFMDSHDVMTKGWKARMQPPLPNQFDSEKLWAQTFDEDKIDMIETDHAPHPPEKKLEAELENPNAEESVPACSGVPGSQDTIPQLLNQERRHKVNLEKIVQKVSDAPAGLLGIKINQSSRVVWSREYYEIGNEQIISGARYTPYLGNSAVGRVVSFKMSGRQLIADGKLTGERVPRPVLMTGQII
jgi:dihydroorotase-like cyclic amidohydrolase